MVINNKDEIFKSGVDFSHMSLFNEKILFAKFWNLGDAMDSSYFKAPLPGNHEGISASTFTGQYLGINKYISEEKVDAAAIALQFLASKESQKKSNS